MSKGALFSLFRLHLATKVIADADGGFDGGGLVGEWYADRLHLSPKYLSNVFKQTLNTSPNTFIDQAILRHAKSLLSSTSLSVQQISDQLGFQNQSHFGTFFKRQTDCSPKDFRLQLSGK